VYIIYLLLLDKGIIVALVVESRKGGPTNQNEGCFRISGKNLCWRAKTSCCDHGAMADRRNVSIHVVGDAFVDLLCYLSGDMPDIGGDSRLSRPVAQMAGGSALNTSTHLQALCGDSRGGNSEILLKLFTAVNPSDAFGRLLLSHVEMCHFEIENCRKTGSESATGHCIVMVTGQERSFLTHNGCMNEFEASGVPFQRMLDPSRPSHIHIAGYYNIEGFWNGKLEQRLKACRDIQPSLTVSVVPQHDASGTWDGGLIALLPCVDFLVLNELEAKCILEHHVVGPPPAGNGLLEQCASFFQSASPSTCVIVTRGALGAVVLREGTVLATQSAAKVDLVDPTGAGDSFCAGFLFGIWQWVFENERMEDKPWPKQALQQGLLWGCATAACSVSKRGASIPAEIKDIETLVKQLEI
jgi:sugar/nucleoside kinase (ribokinase family)